MCGGTAREAPISNNSKGLSPRVRGNRSLRLPLSCQMRSIPACAGEPAIGRADGDQDAVYPRVCGGTLRMLTAAAPVSGLSPRVRGNHRTSATRRRCERSIPACAGEPGLVPWVCSQDRGLSPRVRGNLVPPLRMRVKVGGVRSIPACAGEPLIYHRRQPVSKVYPRVCGGTGIGGQVQEIQPGLSPRVRGNPFLDRALEERIGSIPACAGEPSVALA